MKKTTEIKLNLGCGIQIRKGFINVDKFYTEEELRGKKGFFKQAVIEPGGTYVQADILKLPFSDNYADYVELFNVIEHFPMRKMIDYVKEIYRVMKPGAKLLILTNNMDGLAIDWLDMAIHPPFDLGRFIDVAETIYGNQAAGGEIHLCPFNPPFMDFILTQAGFKQGVVSIFKKNTLISLLPKAVTAPMETINPNAVARNDLLFAEVIK